MRSDPLGVMTHGNPVRLVRVTRRNSGLGKDRGVASLPSRTRMDPFSGVS